MSFANRAWLGLAVITLHNAEETVMTPAWLLPRLPELRARFGVAPLAADAGRLYAGLTLVTIVAAAWVAVAGRAAPRSWASYSLVCLFTIFLVNAFVPHVAGSLLLGAYTPGVFSAATLVVPFCLWFFTMALRERHFEPKRFAIAFLAGVVLYVPGLWAVLGFVPAAQVRLEDLERLEVVPLQVPLDHVQGIDVEADSLWVSSVDRAAKKGYLHFFDLASGRLRAQVSVERGARYHPGGVALDGDSIWVPVAEYVRNGTTLIQRRGKRSLELQGEFEVADHIGCIAAGETLVGGNWDSRTFFEWTRAGRLLRQRPNPTLNAYQDLKRVGGSLIGSGKLQAEQGAIDWLDAGSLALVRRIVTGKTDRGVLFTNEGMAVRDGRLYLLPEDGPSRLFVFRLP